MKGKEADVSLDKLAQDMVEAGVSAARKFDLAEIAEGWHPCDEMVIAVYTAMTKASQRQPT